MNLSYEYSRQWDDYSYTRQDFFNERNEWGLSAYNNPHRLSFNYMYELPIGSNKPYLNFQDWRKVLVDGWALSGISSLVSGEPLVLRAQFNNTGGVLASVRVNPVPGADPKVRTRGRNDGSTWMPFSIQRISPWARLHALTLLCADPSAKTTISP